MKNESSPSRGVSRRRFLKGAAAATTTIAFPTIIPASAYGAQGKTAPSNRIVMGCIGTGSQGTGNLGRFLNYDDLQFVAVCDVDKKHRDNAANMINQKNGNKDCATYNDFRELLARDDLDGLSLALPDHWHSIPVVQAADKGLHMYAEKPLALTIPEGRAMVQAVHKNDIIWQTGSWQRSNTNFLRGCELVRNGYIGEVRTVNVGLPTGKEISPQPVMPVPPELDYDMWLGPAPWAPYTEERCHWDFRWIFDYSGGQLTDWAAHHVDIANWGMGTESAGPIEVAGEGEFLKDGLWNTAINYMVVCRYAAGESPVAPNGFTMNVSNSFPMGAEFVGSEGRVYVSRGDVFETTPATLKDQKLGPNDTPLYESTDHPQNFIDGVKLHRQCVAPIHAAHHAINVAHLGNISMRLERPVQWEPQNEHFVHDDQAERMLARAMRGPWHI